MGRRVAAVLIVLVIAAAMSPLIVAARAGKQVTTSVAASAGGSRTSAPAGGSVASAGPVAAAAPPLLAALQQLVAPSGATVGVMVVELGGSDATTWSLDAGTVFEAASTYKLIALMMEAQDIASGSTDPNGLVCYVPSDYEAGWFDDYALGVCLTRNQLASRAAKQSDNTAGHMLVRDLGGADALNAWAAAAGATSSSFFDGNTTTAADLAVLLVAEADGSLGGDAAQAWLYPLLTGTTTEQGVPAGTPVGSTVLHKTGAIDAVENDAALVLSGPAGPYVLVVMTDGEGGAAGWALIAGISATVWAAEVSRGE